MVISCGHCHEKHDTVAQVRDCSQKHYAKTRPVVVPKARVAAIDAMTQAEITKLAYETIPACNYALVVSGKLCFFRVEVGAKGKWKGFRFVKRLVGSPGSWAKYPTSPVLASVVLKHILKDTYDDSDLLHPDRIYHGPKAAAIRYSRHFTRCAVCSSPLSDPQSIEDGLGPVCAQKF